MFAFIKFVEYGSISVQSFPTNFCSMQLYGNDFVSLGRYALQCKRHVNLENKASNRKSITEELPSEVRHTVDTSNFF